jgi:NTE family protein
MRTLVLFVACAWLAPAPVYAGQDADALQAAARRPRIGVAFGGGSARGLAHVGVVRWFEEHRIPIDLIAGTSMGGLVGGAIAAGMSADELTQLLEGTDWDAMFGSTPFRYKNIRRKEDARSYPSRIEFGLKGGISGPVSLNNGQEVDMLLARIGGPYVTLASFDDLPTPFRAVAVDLVSARQVVLDRGSLALALRATMSLPGIFPPVERDGAMLVDGGALNNVPADIVRELGADVVIAINVGDMSDTRSVSRSILGLMGQTVDVMMLVNTRASLTAADIVVNPPLEGFGSLDWRRSAALAADGYQAAEAMKDRLLPLAVDETQWRAYQEARRTRRRTSLPAPETLSIAGTVPSDQARMEQVLARHVGQPLDVAALETDLRTFAGLDRYESVGWRLSEDNGRYALAIVARPKANAPPFLMLGVTLQNTTADSFSLQLAGRYLAFDVAGSGSEVRIDGAAGAQPGVGAELYRPVGATPFFVGGFTSTRRRTINFVSDDIVVARYNEVRAVAGAEAGLNIGRDSDVRGGFSVGHLDASVDAGDPGLPELHGAETRGRLAFRYDAHDSAVVPSTGLRTVARLDHIFAAPDAPPEAETTRTNDGVTQLEGGASRFWSIRRRDRLFATLAAGSTWGEPLPTEQFQLGAPLRLGAYDVGAIRGNHYAVAAGGYLRGVGRLPDFLGGPIFLGGWVENGAAFDDADTARFRTNISIGGLADTLVGPMLVGASFDFDGAWRYYLAIGRLF